MANLNMEGSFLLTEKNIDEKISKTSAGNYGLGHVNDEQKFMVEYVGRSDDDLNDRLKKWVGYYKQFKFSYASSAKNAFIKECENYHDFGGKEALDNKIHPDRPDGTNWECPKCTHFDN